MKFALSFVLALFLSMVLLASSALAGDVTFTLSFAGDCTLGSEEYLRNRTGSFDTVVNELGFTYPMEKVRDFFLQDDWTVVNLECVLKDTSEGENRKQTFRFRGLPSFVEILSQSGVEMVNLANNHTDDYGKKGMESTKEVLQNAGIAYCEKADEYILEKDGIRIAFLGISITDYNTYGKTLNKRITALKTKEGCQFVVVNMHFGWEYSFVHSKKQFLTSHEVIRSGADLVVGTHPHVVQGIEVYNNRLILYSLGNFVFGGNMELNERSLQAYIAKVKLTFRDGAFYSQQLTILPVHTSGTRPQSNFQPYPVYGDEAQNVVDRIQGDTAFPLKRYKEGIGAVQDTIYAQ